METTIDVGKNERSGGLDLVAVGVAVHERNLTDVESEIGV